MDKIEQQHINHGHNLYLTIRFSSDDETQAEKKLDVVDSKIVFFFLL